jgi:hypothetical protein
LNKIRFLQESQSLGKAVDLNLVVEDVLTSENLS